MTPVPAMQPQATTITISLPNLLSKKKSRNWIAAGVLAVVAAGGGFALYRAVAAPKASQLRREGIDTNRPRPCRWRSCRSGMRPATILSTGSDRACAAMLGTTIGQSAALNTVPAGRVSQILTDLRIAPDSTLDPCSAPPACRVERRRYGDVGPVREVRQRDPHRCHAAGREAPAHDPAQGPGTQRDRAAWRDRTARGVGPREPRAVAPRLSRN